MENIENIVDCGKYGYYYDGGDCYIVCVWDNGWKETGTSFDCQEEEAREFCERYDGCNGDELYAEIFGWGKGGAET